MPAYYTTIRLDQCGHSGGKAIYRSLPLFPDLLPSPFALVVVYETNSNAYALEWSNAHRPVQCKRLKLTLSAIGGGKVWEANLVSFPQTTFGRFQGPKPSIRHEVLVCTLKVDAIVTVDAPKDGMPVFAARIAASMSERIPQDVCFEFPRVGRRIWACEAALLDTSPYFKLCLSSEFSEGQASSRLPPFTTTGASALVKMDTIEDSDEETDVRFLKPPGSGGTKASTTTTNEPPFKLVKIRDTAYTTYRAFLLWTQTGYIQFAPLTSSFHFASDGVRAYGAALEERGDTLKLLAASNGSLQLLYPSPKSVYRLAHFLEVDRLAKLALDNLAAQLTPQNVAVELFSEVSSCFDEVRDVALEYAVANWKVVVKAPATKELERKAQAGELDASAASTALLLAKKLMERHGGFAN
ncbi:hypothetical protein JCM5296_003511 [Sporobolomyces johnsonii]